MKWKKGEPMDKFNGGIYKASDEVIQEIIDKKLYHAPYDDVMKLLTKSCVQINVLEGYWSKYLKIDGQIYWENNMIQPQKFFLCDKCLPSDSTYRKDLLYFMMDDLENSKRIEEELNKQQTSDQKLREEYKKKLKKKKK